MLRRSERLGTDSSLHDPHRFTVTERMSPHVNVTVEPAFRFFFWHLDRDLSSIFSDGATAETSTAGSGPVPRGASDLRDRESMRARGACRGGTGSSGRRPSRGSIRKPGSSWTWSRARVAFRGVLDAGQGPAAGGPVAVLGSAGCGRPGRRGRGRARRSGTSPRPAAVAPRVTATTEPVAGLWRVRRRPVSTNEPPASIRSRAVTRTARPSVRSVAAVGERDLLDLPGRRG